MSGDEEFYADARRTYGSDFFAFMRGVGARQWNIVRSGGEDALLERMEQSDIKGESGGVDVGARAGTFADFGIWLDWARCAFPEVHVEEKAAASWMLSSIPRECIPDDIGTPWGCFLVRIPVGMCANAQMSRDKGWESTVWFSHAFVRRLRSGNWRVSAHSEYHVGTGMIMDLGSTLNALAECARVRPAQFSESGSMEWTDEDVCDGSLEAGRFVARFVLGAILEIANSGSTVRAGGKAALKRAAARQRGEPREWVFQLRPPVILDCREIVRSCAAGGGIPPSVQTLVRGHWKNQRHGPGGALRKFIHVEPYWRGRDDAPIAVRPHILRGEPKPASPP